MDRAAGAPALAGVGGCDARGDPMSGKPTDREPWWTYLALGVLCAWWGFCVAVVLTFFIDWNPYIVWMVASGVAVLAVTAKVAQGARR